MPGQLGLVPLVSQIPLEGKLGVFKGAGWDCLAPQKLALLLSGCLGTSATRRFDSELLGGALVQFDD